MMRLPFFSRPASATVSLIFPWRRPHWWSFRLVFLLIFSLFLHLATFYLFEVVYPASRKQIPREGVVWLLLRDDQGSRALLASHEDRLRVFVGYPGLPGFGSDGESPVSLRLSYDEYKPPLLPLPSRLPEVVTEFPDVVSSGLPPLAPALPDLPPKVLDEQVFVRGRWVVDPKKPPHLGALDEVFPESLLETLRGSSAVLNIGYDADGRIRQVAVISGAGGNRDQSLRQALLACTVPEALSRPPAVGKGAERAWAVLTVEF